MAREARRISETGLYHIVFRGVNHCHLFEENEDFEKFLALLAALKESLDMKVYAYCLMDNHAHLLIQEKSPGDVIIAMKKLLGPYALWFNRKYERSGSLIANRYKSTCIQDEGYLFTLIRYIHQNPLVAGIVKHIDGYRWSSYCEYTKARPSLIDTCFILGQLSSDPQKAQEEFMAFHGVLENKDFSAFEGLRRTEDDIRRGIVSALGEIKLHAVNALSKPERNAAIASLREQGFSIRQIERVTGVSRGIITRSTKRTS